MALSDIIGSLGVSLLLLGFILNLRRILTSDNKFYIGLNISGAILCGYSSYLIHFYPFVILEAVWALAAFSSLFKRVPRETKGSELNHKSNVPRGTSQNV